MVDESRDSHNALSSVADRGVRTLGVGRAAAGRGSRFEGEPIGMTRTTIEALVKIALLTGGLMGAAAYFAFKRGA